MLLMGMEYIFGTFNEGLPVMVLMDFNRFSLNVMRLLAPDSIIDELKESFLPVMLMIRDFGTLSFF